MTRSATAHRPIPPPSAAPWTRAIDRHRARVDRLEHLGHRHRVLLVALDVERPSPRASSRCRRRRRTTGRRRRGRRPAARSGASRARPANVVAELGDQRGVERVVDLGPGERDAGDGAARPGRSTRSISLTGPRPACTCRFRRRPDPWQSHRLEVRRGHRPGVGRGHDPRAAGHRRRAAPDARSAPAGCRGRAPPGGRRRRRARRRDAGSERRGDGRRRDRRARRGPGGRRGPGRRSGSNAPPRLGDRRLDVERRDVRLDPRSLVVGPRRPAGSTSPADGAAPPRPSSSSIGAAWTPTRSVRHGARPWRIASGPASTSQPVVPASRDRGRGPGRSRSGPAAARTPG